MGVDKKLSIFVRNLPVCPLPEMEELLYELFLQSGPVNQVFIPFDKETGTHRGYGFVEYMHAESVAYTCALMTNVQLFGRTLWIHPVKSEDDRTCDEAIEDSVVPEMADNDLDLSALDPNQAHLLQMLLSQAAANMLPPPLLPPPPLPPMLHDYSFPPPPLPCTSAPLLPPLPCTSAPLLPPLPPHLLTPPLLPGSTTGFLPPPPGFPSPNMANFSFSVFPPNLPPPLVNPEPPAFPMTQAACFAKRRRKRANKEENVDNTYPTANWQTIT